MPIPVPNGVSVSIQGNEVTVSGPKGRLTQRFHPDMRVELEDGHLRVSRPTDARHHRALHGLTRALLNNMVTGVTQGFEKKLEVQGVGYCKGMAGCCLGWVSHTRSTSLRRPGSPSAWTRVPR